MFGFLKKGPISTFLVLGKRVNVASITRDGQLLYTDQTIENYPKHHLEGKVFEISFATHSGNPYFAYYLCDNYYADVANPGVSGNLTKAMETEKFRSEVSHKVGLFLSQYLKKELRIDASKEIRSFSHNRAHTNVLTVRRHIKWDIRGA